MKKRTKEYDEYMQSLAWEEKRQEAICRAGHKCQSCGRTRDLEVHHLHYNTLFDERPEDLQVLCVRCHKIADEQRGRKARYAAGLNTFAMKKYPDGGDLGEIAEEYDRWLERQSD